MNKQNKVSLKQSQQIPNFVQKLQAILSDEQNKEIIEWTSKGTGFQVLNQQELKQKVLPQYYRHSNLTSFVRQLNMYGFRKIKDEQRQYYMHPFFRKNQLSLSANISRKPEKKVTILEKPSKESESSIKKNVNSLLMFDENFDSQQKDQNIDSFLLSKMTHESSASLQFSQKHFSLANLLAKSQINISNCLNLQDNLSICDNLVLSRKEISEDV